jgi:hypothetical protein
MSYTQVLVFTRPAALVAVTVALQSTQMEQVCTQSETEYASQASAEVTAAHTF